MANGFTGSIAGAPTQRPHVGLTIASQERLQERNSGRVLLPQRGAGTSYNRIVETF
jgi:hypothetical protein